MEEQTQDSVSLEIPSRWRRFSAYLLDLVINIILWGIIPYIIFIFTDGSIASIIIGLILLTFEIIFIIYEKNTTGNELVGIIPLNNENNPISRWKSILRNFVFNPAFFSLLLLLIWFLIAIMLYMINSVSSDETFITNPIKLFGTIGNRSSIVGLILFFISIIELFFKCPTFIDKRLGIKRFYKKSK